MRTDQNKPVNLVLKQVRLCDDGRKSHNAQQCDSERRFSGEMGRSIKKLNGFIKQGLVAISCKTVSSTKKNNSL